MSFHLDVVSLNGKLFSDDVNAVTLPSTNGQLTVYSRHMSLIAPLTTGEVFIKTNKEDLLYTIGKGVFSIKNNLATLLIEDATSAEEISEDKANEARKHAEEIIEKGVEGPEMQKALYS